MPCCAALFVFVFCTHPSLRGLEEAGEVVEEEEDESRGCMIGSFCPQALHGHGRQSSKQLPPIA